MKTCDDLTFISTYWNELKSVCERIETELPKVNKPNKIKRISKKFGLIKFSDLENWDVKSLFNSNSPKLTALADKISHMIQKGDAPNIKPMLERICFKGIKKQSEYNLYGNNYFIGHAHLDGIKVKHII